MKGLRSLVLGLLGLAALSTAGHAATQLYVAVPEAALFSAPQASSIILGKLSKGTVVTVSNRSLKGWHKVLVASLPEGTVAPLSDGSVPEFGWIDETELSATTDEAELRRMGIQSTVGADERKVGRWTWYIQPHVGFMLMAPNELQAALGTTESLGLGYSPGLEFGFRPSTFQSLGISLDYLLVPLTAVMAHSAVATAQFEYTFLHALPWKLGIGGGAGAAVFFYVNGYQAGKTLVPFDPFVVPVFDFKLVGRYYTGENFALMAKLGARVLLPSSVAITASTSADASFSGFLLELGAQFDWK